MRRRLIIGLLLAVLGHGLVAPAVTMAQENPNRPTREAPPPGQPLTRPQEDRPWSYNWVARPLIVMAALFLVALAAGYLIRWVGVGRRTA